LTRFRGEKQNNLCKLAKDLRSNLTPAEQGLWKHLRHRQLEGLKFRRQCPIGKFIVDFVCLEKKLIVEVDGIQHSENKEYDYQREEWLEQEGYTVLRFWNNEVQNNLDGVLEEIRKHVVGIK